MPVADSGRRHHRNVSRLLAEGQIWRTHWRHSHREGPLREFCMFIFSLVSSKFFFRRNFSSAPTQDPRLLNLRPLKFGLEPYFRITPPASPKLFCVGPPLFKGSRGPPIPGKIVNFQSCWPHQIFACRNYSQVIIHRIILVYNKKWTCFLFLQYASSSTTASVGGLRSQFSLPENIRMSLFTAEFFRDMRRYLTVQCTYTSDYFSGGGGWRGRGQRS